MGHSGFTRRQLLQAATVPAIGAFGASAMAQGSAGAFPQRPLRVFVPYAAGGTVDFVTRAVTQQMAKTLGQSIVVENKPGGGTNIAAEATLNAPADGYTLFAASRANAINASLPRKPKFDVLKDFAPVALLAEVPNVLVINPALPVKTVADLVALARSKPSRMTYASAGTGGSTHMAGELFNSLAGTQIVHVPYKGGSQAVVDVISGQVDMYFGTMPSVMSHVKAGKLRALAVSGLRRSEIEASLPTLDELGLKGFSEISWIGLMAPAATPAPVVSKLHAEATKALAAPELRAQLAGQGAEVMKATQAEFTSFLRADIANTTQLVAKAHISVD